LRDQIEMKLILLAGRDKHRRPNKLNSNFSKKFYNDYDTYIFDTYKLTIPLIDPYGNNTTCFSNVVKAIEEAQHVDFDVVVVGDEELKNHLPNKGKKRFHFVLQGSDVGENIQLAFSYLESMCKDNFSTHVLVLNADLLTIRSEHIDSVISVFSNNEKSDLIASTMNSSILKRVPRGYIPFIDDYFNSDQRKILLKEGNYFFVNRNVRFDLISELYAVRKIRYIGVLLKIVKFGIIRLGVRESIRTILKGSRQVYVDHALSLQFCVETLSKVLNTKISLIQCSIEEFGLDMDSYQDIDRLGYSSARKI